MAFCACLVSDNGSVASRPRKRREMKDRQPPRKMERCSRDTACSGVFPRARESCSPASSNPVRTCSYPCVSSPRISDAKRALDRKSPLAPCPFPGAVMCPSENNWKTLLERTWLERTATASCQREDIIGSRPSRELRFFPRQRG